MCGDPYCPYCGTLLGSRAELEGLNAQDQDWDPRNEDEDYPYFDEEDSGRYDDDPNPYHGDYSEE